MSASQSETDGRGASGVRRAFHVAGVGLILWLLAFPCVVGARPVERTTACATPPPARVEASRVTEAVLTAAPVRQAASEVAGDPGYRIGFFGLLILFLILGTWAAAQWIRLNKLRERIGHAAFLRIAFDETDEPILVLRPSLRVVEANLAAAASFGYDVDELRGMPLRALLGMAEFQRFVEASRRVLRTSREGVDVTLLSHASELIPARATLRTLGAGGERRLLVTFRPASASTPAPEPLTTAPEPSESAPEAASEPSVPAPSTAEPARSEAFAGLDARGPLAYLTNLGHEMRTQLTGILGFAEVLEEELTGRQKETAQLVRRSGQRLLHTVNEILMLSRLEAGGVTLHPQEVDVTAEIAEEVQLLLRWAEEKGLGLHVRQPAMPVMARIDPGAFRRVLENLVSNAIKYTEHGTVEIGVRTDAEHLYLTVKDTGIGISPEFMPHLFEEFSRESSGVVGRQEGTGLGLAITKRLVEMMHGEIHVESEPGKGTRFLVVFPLHEEVSTGEK
ncbi:PAS domain-containing sensor histidine kinase [Rhodocaloribacter sp.]